MGNSPPERVRALLVDESGFKPALELSQNEVKLGLYYPSEFLIRQLTELHGSKEFTTVVYRDSAGNPTAIDIFGYLSSISPKR